MENNAENGNVTSPAVAAEPLTAAIVVKRLQRGTVTLARNYINAALPCVCSYLNNWQRTPGPRTVEKDDGASAFKKGVYQKVPKTCILPFGQQGDAKVGCKRTDKDLTQKCPYSWTWRPEERYTWKVVSTKFKLLRFGFWLRFIKPEFISMHHGRWWGCARYICTYSWTRNKILWLCEAFHLEA